MELPSHITILYLFSLIKNNLYRDSLPTVHLQAWPLSACLFDGELAAGPVPTLYAEDPEAVIDIIGRDLIKLHSDISKINKIFFAAETLSVGEAAALLKKPR